MAENATKDDINRIHDRLDPIAENLAEIRATLKLMPKTPKQPCTYLDSHLTEHKATTNTWKTFFIRATVDVVKMALVAIATYFFVKKN